MKPIEIVEKIKATNPKAFGALSPEKAAKLVNLVLVNVGKQVADTQEGTIKVAGLGTFIVKQREQMKGEEVVNVKRVVLRPAKIRKAD